MCHTFIALFANCARLSAKHLRIALEIWVNEKEQVGNLFANTTQKD